MLGKLTWAHYGLIVLAGLAACSQEAREPVVVGTVQIDLRNDLVFSKTPGSSTTLLAEGNQGHPSQTVDLPPTTRRIALSERESYSQDRAYRNAQRDEFPSTSVADPKARKSSTEEDGAHENSWTLADKPWVRAGKGFGVAAEERVSPGSVHLDDTSYYSPTVALKPYSKASEHLEPMTEPFKNRKPLIFHSGATGFAHETSEDVTPSGHSPAFGTRLELSPTPETQVYLSSQPKTRVILVPSKNRLDLMNGNENINQNRFRQQR